MQFHVLFYVDGEKQLGRHEYIWVSARGLVLSAYASLL